MTQLLDTLNTQHAHLKRVIAEIDRDLARRDLDGVSAELGRLIAGLQAHVGLENAEFYPAMTRMADAQGAEQMRQIVQLFDVNMRHIADGVLKSLDRHRQGPLDAAAFARDWASTSPILQRRIADEENTLHPIYQRLAAADGR